MKPRISIYTIAKQAGVSHQTVSRVINNSPLVKEDIRRRVLAIIDELHYVPSKLARNLRGGSSSLLGLVVPDNPNPFWGTVVRSIEDLAYDAGYCTIICSSDDNIERETRYLNILRERRVDGIILGPCIQRQRSDDTYLRLGIPLVTIDHRWSGFDSVTLDNITAAAQATQHLIDLGHKRIGIITGPVSTTSGRGRLLGYRRALRRAGLPIEQDLQVHGSYRRDMAEKAARQLLLQPQPPTALIAASNVLAMGALTAVGALGLAIPRDLAFVTFDEMGWDPALVAPLTTLAQPTQLLGTEACHLLLKRLNGSLSGDAQHRTLPGQLIVRASSGALNGGAEPPGTALQFEFTGAAQEVSYYP